MKNINYTVEFIKMIGYGEKLQSDGTTIIPGFEECFYTESEIEALKEFEARKKEVTQTNNLGVILEKWINDSSIGSESYTSQMLLEAEWDKELAKKERIS